MKYAHKVLTRKTDEGYPKCDLDEVGGILKPQRVTDLQTGKPENFPAKAFSQENRPYDDKNDTVLRRYLCSCCDSLKPLNWSRGALGRGTIEPMAPSWGAAKDTKKDHAQFNCEGISKDDKIKSLAFKGGWKKVWDNPDIQILLRLNFDTRPLTEEIKDDDENQWCRSHMGAYKPHPSPSFENTIKFLDKVFHKAEEYPDANILDRVMVSHRGLTRKLLEIFVKDKRDIRRDYDRVRTKPKINCNDKQMQHADFPRIVPFEMHYGEKENHASRHIFNGVGQKDSWLSPCYRTGAASDFNDMLAYQGGIAIGWPYYNSANPGSLMYYIDNPGIHIVPSTGTKISLLDMPRLQN